MDMVSLLHNAVVEDLEIGAVIGVVKGHTVINGRMKVLVVLYDDEDDEDIEEEPDPEEEDVPEVEPEEAKAVSGKKLKLVAGGQK